MLKKNPKNKKTIPKTRTLDYTEKNTYAPYILH